MCCATAAFAMALLAGWRALSRTRLVRSGRLRRITIAFVAVSAVVGSAFAASQLGEVRDVQPDSETRLNTMPICSHLAGMARVSALSDSTTLRRAPGATPMAAR
jgi:hypothetical protein